MIYLKVALLIACIVAGILFGVSNQQGAALQFFSYTTRPYPLYLILFISFLLGAFVSLVYNVLAGSDMETKEKLVSERVKELEKLTKEREEEFKVYQKTRAKDEGERKPAGEKTPDLAEKG